MITSGDGLRKMNLVRAEISNIIKLEEDALVQEQARFEANMRLLFVIILIASLFGLLLALSFTYLINQGNSAADQGFGSKRSPAFSGDPDTDMAFILVFPVNPASPLDAVPGSARLPVRWWGRNSLSRAG